MESVRLGTLMSGDILSFGVGEQILSFAFKNQRFICYLSLHGLWLCCAFPTMFLWQTNTDNKSKSRATNGNTFPQNWIANEGKSISYNAMPHKIEVLLVHSFPVFVCNMQMFELTNQKIRKLQNRFNFNVHSGFLFVKCIAGDIICGFYWTLRGKIHAAWTHTFNLRYFHFSIAISEILIAFLVENGKRKIAMWWLH